MSTEGNMLRWNPKEKPPTNRQIITCALIHATCARCGQTFDWVKPDGTPTVFGDGYLRPNALLRCRSCGNWAEFRHGVLLAGVLQIARPKKSPFTRMLGDRGEATIADLDIATYPQIENVRTDPQVLRPDLCSYLNTADLFLVRRESRASTIAVVRCPSHHLSIPLSQVPPVGIHVEAHRVRGWFVFGVYALVWDNPQKPWFAEHTVIPYEKITENKEERSCPRVYGYEWRKLFYLLTQENTELIFLDEKDRVASLRSTSLRPRQATQFTRLVNLLESCSRKHVTMTMSDVIAVYNRYRQTVTIEEIQARFPPHQQIE